MPGYSRNLADTSRAFTNVFGGSVDKIILFLVTLNFLLAKNRSVKGFVNFFFWLRLLL